MKAIDFDYRRPDTLAEACGLLAAAKDDAKIIAGGQTLVPLLAMRLARPALLIDINRIPELAGIEEAAGFVAIRACTRQARALADATVRRRLPLLAKALRFVGHVQTRNRGTVGGSLAHGDPAAEIGLATLALDAEIEVRSAAAARTIPAARFFAGPLVTALEPDECLTAVRFPLPEGGGARGTGFQETSIRRSDFALAAAAVELGLDGGGVCRSLAVAVGGTGATPVRLAAVEAMLLGTRLEDAAIAEAARLARETIEATDDLHASAAHRRRMAAALVARALAEARAEARAERS